MREWTAFLIGMILIVGVCFGVVTCVDVANSKETTTLDEAIERPVKIERYVDKKNGVACYWNTRHPAYLTCVKVPPTSRRNER